MKQRELVEEVRERLDDIDGNTDDRDLLYSTERIVAYLNRAQDLFCVRTGYIRDVTSTPLVINTVAAQTVYPVPSHVIQLYGIKDVTNDVWLGRKDLSIVPAASLRAQSYIIPDDGSTAPVPAEFSTDQQTGSIVLSSAPDGIYPLELFAWRRAYKKLTSENETRAPEIPEQFHHQLVEYVIWKALGHYDADTLDPSVAGAAKAEWKDALREGKQEFRLSHANLPSFAVGTSGWAW